MRACVRVSEHVRPRNVHRGRGQEMGGEGRGGRCHDSDVRRQGANPALSPRARARTHTDMHTRAHRGSPSDTLEGKVKLKARERGGWRSRRRAP